MPPAILQLSVDAKTGISHPKMLPKVQAIHHAESGQNKEAMRKTMSPEHKAAFLAGRDARTKAIAAKCASQTITIDENWSIVRVDERNWSIRNKRAEKDGFENENFFGSLFAALNGLPAHILNDEGKTSLAFIVDCQKGIRARIAQAVHAIEKQEVL